ncbi:MAG: hypothetical protein H7210_03225 [Pyrinomonadaceae bacterium]|nr:hypothetical protein [Phycisphaerales bacterium]
MFHGALLVTVAFFFWKYGGMPHVMTPPPVVSFADPSLGSVGENPAEQRSGTSAPGGGPVHDRSRAERADSTETDSTPMVIAGAVLLEYGSSPPRRHSLAQTSATPEAVGLALGIGSGPRAPGGISSISNGASEADTAVSTLSASSGSTVTFAGLGSSGARSVVYVVDASGSMVSSLRDVVAEIERSVARLAPSQKFGVVVFHDARSEGAAGEGEDANPRTESFMPILIRATPDARSRLTTWLAGIEPKGKSNPLDGLRAGLALKSEAVFLLSRSIERTGGGVWQLGLDATMEELDRLNPLDRTGSFRSVAIKTIQFMDEDPTGIMQAIGLNHGGVRGAQGDAGYKVVRRGKDLE